MALHTAQKGNCLVIVILTVLTELPGGLPRYQHIEKHLAD